MTDVRCRNIVRWEFREGERLLPPLKFSDGRTQADLAAEVIEKLIEHGLVFLQATVGSGKSAVALHVCKHFGRGIIVVPVRKLQDQYENDYESRRNVGGMRVALLKGRGNFECPFAKRRADYPRLPCTVKLPPTAVRWEIASKCKYWNPIYPSNFKLPIEEDLRHSYLAVGGPRDYVKRGDGCDYCDQYGCYTRPGVIVMNSKKWLLETLMGRKPAVDVEIFDEGDLFLDGLSLRESFGEPTARRLREEGEHEAADLITELLEGTVDALKFLERAVNLLRHTSSKYAQNIYTKVSLLAECISWVEFERKPKSVEFVLPRPDILLRRLLALSASKILFMSATSQSEVVLKEVYNISPVFVHGERKFPGTVYVGRVGLEQRITNRTWASEHVRSRYYQCLRQILSRAHRPTLVNVHAYKYLSKTEGTPSSEELWRGQDTQIENFLENGGVVWATKLDRGIDLPKERCRSIVMLKAPFPDLKDPLLRAMRRRFGSSRFWKYYDDKAQRDFLQSLGRGVRSGDDWVQLWSPDEICHNFLRCWHGEKVPAKQLGEEHK